MKCDMNERLLFFKKNSWISLHTSSSAQEYTQNIIKRKVLAECRTEEVAAQLPNDYRQSFTAISTISADGSKFPPVFLAKGKTNQCHKQFDGMKSTPSSYFTHQEAILMKMQWFSILIVFTNGCSIRIAHWFLICISCKWDCYRKSQRIENQTYFYSNISNWHLSTIRYQDLRNS